jgi:hypothetical protein
MWIGHTIRKAPSDITKAAWNAIHREPGQEDDIEQHGDGQC